MDYTYQEPLKIEIMFPFPTTQKEPHKLLQKTFYFGKRPETRKMLNRTCQNYPRCRPATTSSKARVKLNSIISRKDRNYPVFTPIKGLKSFQISPRRLKRSVGRTNYKFDWHTLIPSSNHNKIVTNGGSHQIGTPSILRALSEMKSELNNTQQWLRKQRQTKNRIEDKWTVQRSFISKIYN